MRPATHVKDDPEPDVFALMAGNLPFVCKVVSPDEVLLEPQIQNDEEIPAANLRHLSIHRRVVLHRMRL